ncbi:MAG: TIGR01212 family radical SAM protein [Thermodesulfobacterium geofontis]|uniref:TIGR01212 family radical SAM protein n=1 Tax=Thermodesulfobacterium geofontis TaxID=1295609 RepID=A0A2N7PLJ8_9BACT|nr:MAG: TIGR01212 family radical SAM protein [Thermodesulfobacterium geofontis]
MKTQRLYYTLNEFLKEKFGEKVKKIPLDAGLTCPNRDGTKGLGGCIYCDSKGSGTGFFKEGKSLEEQVKFFLEIFKSKKFNKFIAYFQSFSNTYAPVEKLKELYDIVFIDPSIVGLAIGTRPDCIDEKNVDLLKTYQEKGYYLWVELGLQSIFNKTLELINRGHTFEDFLEAYSLLKENNIPVVVHIIFGLPEETKEMMMETVKTLAKLKVDGIKFHALYIPKGSKMEEIYLKGEYKPLEMEEYVELVAYALTYLPPSTVVHRVCSEAKEEDILAPLWITKKMEVINLLRKVMSEKELYQGKNYPP